MSSLYPDDRDGACSDCGRVVPSEFLGLIATKRFCGACASQRWLEAWTRLHAKRWYRGWF